MKRPHNRLAEPRETTAVHVRGRPRRCSGTLDGRRRTPHNWASSGPGSASLPRRTHREDRATTSFRSLATGRSSSPDATS